MNVNDNFCLEEELFGSEGGREPTRKCSWETPQGIVTKQTRKRRRKPTMEMEKKKKMGP